MLFCSAAPDPLWDPLQTEMRRAMQDLSLEGYPKPYFISLRLTAEAYEGVDFREGQPAGRESQRQIFFVPEVRVGSYEFDQTPDMGAAQMANEPFVLDVSCGSITRHYIWNALDQAYKKACEQYFFKKSKRSAEGALEYSTDDFSRETPVVARDRAVPVEDMVFGRRDSWQEEISSYTATVTAASRHLGGHPMILRSLVRLGARRRRIFFLNSEGTLLAYPSQWFSVYLSVYGRSNKGLALHLTKTFYGTSAADLPGLEHLQEAIHQLRQKFFALSASSEARGVLAPCVLDSQAASELFLAFAGKLQGEAQRDPAAAQTFRDKIGKRVLPSFLSLIDDPTLEAYGDRGLLGHYFYDEEGVAARKVVLIEGGILKNFLMSRRPLKGLPHQSNGHGRASSFHRPQARVGTLLVGSKKKMKEAHLQALLLEEVRRRGAPYGLRIEGLQEVYQQEGTGSHQTFRAAPQMMYFVYPDGRQELAHNGEIVGTPLKLMQSILATGETMELHQGLDSGPSGSVAVSVAAPAVLLAEIEVQKGAEQPLRPPFLPSPLEAQGRE